MNTTFLKASDIASILKISKALSYRLIAKGEIASVKFGRVVRVRQEDLERFIAKNQSDSGTDPNGSQSCQEGNHASSTTRLHGTTRLRFLQRDFKIYTHWRMLNREGDRHELQKQMHRVPRLAPSASQRAQAFRQNKRTGCSYERRGTANLSSAISATISTPGTA